MRWRSFLERGLGAALVRSDPSPPANRPDDSLFPLGSRLEERRLAERVFTLTSTLLGTSVIGGSAFERGELDSPVAIVQTRF